MVVRDLPILVKPTNIVCREYQLVNKTNRIFMNKEYSTMKPLELICIDFCGHTRTRGSNEERYFMLLIDDFYRMIWVTFIKDKFEAFDIFKVFKSMVENQVDAKIKCLR